MRSQTTKLYKVDGDRGNEKPAGSILGFVTWFPNETVHGQTERILREINMALRTESGSNMVKPDPSPDYTHIKLIRYTSEHLVYEVSRHEAVVSSDAQGGIMKNTNIVVDRYILIKP